MHGLKDRGIRLNRKSLSEIAIADSDGFAVILKEATKK
jgi:ribosomal protein L20